MPHCTKPFLPFPPLLRRWAWPVAVRWGWWALTRSTWCCASRCRGGECGALNTTPTPSDSVPLCDISPVTYPVTSPLHPPVPTPRFIRRYFRGLPTFSLFSLMPRPAILAVFMGATGVVMASKVGG